MVEASPCSCNIVTFTKASEEGEEATTKTATTISIDVGFTKSQANILAILELQFNLTRRKSHKQTLDFKTCHWSVFGLMALKRLPQ